VKTVLHPTTAPASLHPSAIKSEYIEQAEEKATARFPMVEEKQYSPLTGNEADGPSTRFN
jgi:hypothetical protein